MFNYSSRRSPTGPAGEQVDQRSDTEAGTMFRLLYQSVGRLFASRAGRRAARTVVEHAFRKFPAQHADKAVRAAFKVGVAVGKKVVGG